MHIEAALITALVMFVGLAIALAMVTHDVRAIRNWTKDLVAQLGAEARPAGGIGRYKDHRYEFRYMRYRGRNKSAFGVLLHVNVPDEVIIRSISMDQDLAVAIGLADRVETGVPDFDRRFAVMAREGTLDRYGLRDPARLASIRRLFDSGATHLTYSVEEQCIRVEWGEFGALGDWNAKKVTAALDDMVPLADRLPRDAVADRDIARPSVSGRFLPYYVVSISLFGMGGFFALVVDNQYTPLDRQSVFLQSFAASVVLLGAFGYHAYTRLKFSLDAYRYWFGLMVVSAVSFPVAGYAVAVYINGAHDVSTPAVSVHRVLDKEKRASNGTFDHLIYVGRPDAGKPASGMMVGRDLYARLVPGESKVTVTIHHGRLGAPWQNLYKDVRLADPP